MSNFHKFRNRVVTLNAFHIPTKNYTPRISNDSNKKKKRNIQHISLELNPSISADNNSPFLLASSGNLQGLKSFNEIFGNILKVQDEQHATVLHHASSANQVAIMQYLIDSGIELNTADNDGCTALHVAILQEHVEATNVLLNSGIDDKIVNVKGDAGIHIAARSNNTNLLAAYLENPHITIAIKGYRERTALHVIAEHDNVEACEVFHNFVMMKKVNERKEFRLCSTDEDGIT